MEIRKYEKLVKELSPYKISNKPCSDGRYKAYVKDVTKPHGRRVIPRKTYAELIMALYEFYAPVEAGAEQKGRNLTLRELYPEWQQYKRLHTNAETTITRMHTDWKTYYLEDPIIDKPIRLLTKGQLDIWAHSLIKKYSMTKTNYYNVSGIIRQALDYAVDVGYLDENVFRKVKVDKRMLRKTEKKPDNTQVFSEDEERQIIDLAWADFRNRTKVYELSPLAIIFQSQTGVRIGELCTLQFSDIDGEQIHVQRMLRRDMKEVVEHTKSECGDRHILLTPLAKEVVEECRKRQKELGIINPYIFSIRPGEPLPERPIADLYKKYCKKLGIVQKSSHKMRKTFVSALIDEGMNINSVMKMAGHADAQTTYRSYVYDRATDEKKKALMESALCAGAVGK